MSQLSIKVARERAADGGALVRVDVVAERTSTTFHVSEEYAKVTANALLEASTGLVLVPSLPPEGAS